MKKQIKKQKKQKKNDSYKKYFRNSFRIHRPEIMRKIGHFSKVLKVI